MGKCKKENKDKKRVVTLPGSYMMTRTIPGPNYFIRVQLYTPVKIWGQKKQKYVPSCYTKR